MILILKRVASWTSDLQCRLSSDFQQHRSMASFLEFAFQLSHRDCFCACEAAIRSVIFASSIQRHRI